MTPPGDPRSGPPPWVRWIVGGLAAAGYGGAALLLGLGMLLLWYARDLFGATGFAGAASWVPIAIGLATALTGLAVAGATWIVQRVAGTLLAARDRSAPEAQGGVGDHAAPSQDRGVPPTDG